MAEFSVLIGKTISSITAGEDSDGNDTLTFVCSDSTQYLMSHSQENGEEFEYNLGGSISDATDSEVLTARRVEYPQCTVPPGESSDDDVEFFTWTIFKLYTVKGTCDIKWLGTSTSAFTNRIDFEEIEG
jgi:hypothetical protein